MDFILSIITYLLPQPGTAIGQAVLSQQAGGVQQLPLVQHSVRAAFFDFDFLPFPA
jgi:hypothetical protein